MASPKESASNEIDLFSVDETTSIRSAEPRPGPIALVDSPVRSRRYHSMQLAIVTGVFACGGFLCSLFFVEGDADFPQPHHWVRKSYSSPVVTEPPAFPGASLGPQRMSPRPNQGNKTAALQRRQISHREMAPSPSHTVRSSAGIGPVIALRTKWTNFSDNLRDRATSARNQTLDFGRRLRQYHFEPRRLFVPVEIATNADDAG